MNSNYSIDKTYYEIDGPIEFKITLISDLHDIKSDKIIQIIKGMNPDIICVCGDLILNDLTVSEGLLIHNYISLTQNNSICFLNACSKICPTYLSFGNHEWIVTGDDINRIKSTGTVVLDNSWQKLRINNVPVVIGGLNSAFLDNFRYVRKMNHDYSYYYNGLRTVSNPINYDWLSDFEKLDGYKILLSHHPEYWTIEKPYLSSRKIDLVLAGHAHGGQIRIGKQGLFASGQGWFPHYTSGIFRGEYGAMIISRGLSNPVKVPRIFNNPEIVFIRVRK